MRRVASAIYIDETWTQIARPLQPLPLPPATYEAGVGVDTMGRGWRNVKVWVALSPLDTTAERAALIDQVFPALNKWAEVLKIRCIPVDGSSEAWTGDASDIAAMTDCKLQNGGSLVVLALLSSTYGNTATKPVDGPESQSKGVSDPQASLPSQAETQDEAGVEVEAERGDAVVRDVQYTAAAARGISPLHAQIVHGALKTPNPHALFFVRRVNNCHGNVSVHALESFEDRERLRHLKRHVRRAVAPSAITEYEYDADLSLIQFATDVLEGIKSRLTELYVLQENVESDVLRKEEHNWHCARVARNSFGRDEELQLFKEYIFPSVSDEEDKLLDVASAKVFNELQDASTGNIWKSDVVAYCRQRIHREEARDADVWSIIVAACPTVRPQSTELDDWEFTTLYKSLALWSHMMVIAADCGAGKTSLLCQVAAMTAEVSERQQEKGRLDSIIYLPEVCAGSENMALLVNRIGRALTGDAYSVGSFLTDERLEKELWKLFIESFVADKKILIVIDDIHRLQALPVWEGESQVPGTQTLAWMPLWLPPNVKVVVSVSSTAPAYEVLNNRFVGADAHRYVHRLAALGMSCSSRLTKECMTAVGVTWTDEQISVFLSKQMVAANPLYLRLACGEMRLVGPSDAFEDEVMCLPNDISHLIYWILDRLMEQGGAKVMLLLCLLDAAWPSGLNEVVLMQLLDNDSVLEALYTDPWPGGSVHKCPSLDAFFESAQHRIVIEAVPSNCCSPSIGVARKSTQIRKLHSMGNIGSSPTSTSRLSIGHAKKIDVIRRAQSEGDAVIIASGSEENFGGRCLPFANDKSNNVPWFAVGGKLQLHTYSNFARLVTLVGGMITVMERKGTVNFCHSIFQQAVRDYCVLFEPESDNDITVGVQEGNAPRRKMMHRQSSLERKYFSTGDRLLFKRNLGYFKELLTLQCEQR